MPEGVGHCFPTPVSFDSGAHGCKYQHWQHSFHSEHKMARYLRIRHVVKSDRTGLHELISAVCGLNYDGTHWTLTQEQAVSQIEDRTSAFYIEGPRGRRVDVMVAMDLHANKYLRAAANCSQSDELLFLPPCLHLVHAQNTCYREAKAGR